MVVTEVIPIDKKKRKVCLDSGYTFPLYISEIRRFKISENVELDMDKLSEIHTILVTRVKNRILYLLGDSDKSTYSVKSKMKMAGYPDDVVECAVDTLTEYGYLNDERFARNYIEYMRDYRGKSRREIYNNLLIKGISEDLIGQIISEYDFDEYTLVIKAIRKKNIDEKMICRLDIKKRNSLYRYLMRKGFDRNILNKFFHGNY